MFGRASEEQRYHVSLLAIDGAGLLMWLHQQAKEAAPCSRHQLLPLRIFYLFLSTAVQYYRLVINASTW
jgi:hypothetical protein